MHLSFNIKLLVRLFFIVPVFAFAQTQRQIDVLQKTALLYKAKELNNQQQLIIIAKQKGWDLIKKDNTSRTLMMLTGVDVKGFPLYTQTDNASIPATTTQTNYLWQNSFGVNGSSAAVKNKLAIWDGGAVNNNHIEIAGRIINKDFSSNLNHSTHVGGIMIAQGVNPASKGMAYGTQQLINYDYNNHISEIATEAENLLLSNHSYGITCGWSKLETATYWTYYGLPGDTADYKFGIYDAETQMLDSIAFAAPNYLMVKSVGNNRDKNGPSVGEQCYIYDNNGILVLKPRPAGISNNNGYDIIPTYGIAKNILTVGAVEGIIGGIPNSSNIKMSSFSSWGPTDDGRIKPDLVADGVNVFNCTSDGNTAYESYSGTSMATPNVTGSLFLLQELYNKKHNGSFMNAATLKALAIHTTTDAGNFAGPDYKFGWGLLNAKNAADIIAGKDTAYSKIVETLLNNSDTFKLNVIASGNGKLMATIAWADAPATPTTTNLLNNPSLKLINDLDIRIIHNGTTYFPWTLNPTNPDAAATKADNFRDNVEKIELDTAIPGDTYQIQITHKNTLQKGLQNFSLIVSGVGGNTFCQPYTTNNNSVRIDSVRIADLFTTSISCNNYINSTNTTATLKPKQTYNVNVGLGNCNNTGNNKIAKLYIDYNNNGSFNDAGELVFTSSVIIGFGTTSGSFTTPDYLINNNTALMRLVIAETTDVTSFDACSTTATLGAIQDFLVKFSSPQKDVAVTDIEIPTENFCAANNQFISIKLFNNGDSTIENIPVTAIVKKGATITNLLTGTYAAKLQPNQSAVFTFQQPILTLADSVYNITATANLIDDNYSNNNTLTQTFTIKSKSILSSGQANVCNNLATLKVFGASNTQNYAWFAGSNKTNFVATGDLATTSTIANKYYLTTGFTASLGAANNTISNNGDYQAKGGNYFYYTANSPVLLQSAKLYTAYPGKVFIKVADTVRTYSDGRYDYTTLNATTIDVQASNPQPATGNVAGYNAADTGLTYNINLLLPKGKHILIVSTDSIANIFRNKSITTSPYPNSIANLISITGNNATTPDSFYYYLYNMQIRTLDCESDEYPVNTTFAALPIITKNGDTLISSAGINYQWQKDGVDILGETNKTFIPTLAGNYSVVVTDFGGCTQSSKVFNSDITNGLLVYPNPAKKFVQLALTANEADFTLVDIYDILGKKYLSKIYNTVTNAFSDKIDISNFPNGIYFIKLYHAEKTYSAKLVVGR